MVCNRSSTLWMWAGWSWLCLPLEGGSWRLWIQSMWKSTIKCAIFAPREVSIGWSARQTGIGSWLPSFQANSCIWMPLWPPCLLLPLTNSYDSLAGDWTLAHMLQRKPSAMHPAVFFSSSRSYPRDAARMTTSPLAFLFLRVHSGPAKWKLKSIGWHNERKRHEMLICCYQYIQIRTDTYKYIRIRTNTYGHITSVCPSYTDEYVRYVRYVRIRMNTYTNTYAIRTLIRTQYVRIRMCPEKYVCSSTKTR